MQIESGMEGGMKEAMDLLERSRSRFAETTWARRRTRPPTPGLCTLLTIPL